MPFVDLLLSAGNIQLHQFHRTRVLKIRDWWIVKREMPVFADSQAAKIDRLGAQQLAIAFALIERQKRVTGDIMEGPRADAAFDALTHITAKAGRVIGVDSQVFVHMEQGELGPIDA